MDLTPGQRKAAFGAIVLALAGLGAFLLVPGSQQASGTSRPAGTAASGPAAAFGAPPTAPAAAPATSAATAPAGGPAVDIYRLLPFTQADLDQAVAGAQRFAVDYGTWSYLQSAASYVAPMRSLAAPGLATTIERGFATPGVAAVRIRQKQVATASATVVGLRAFGPASLVFVVKIAQTIAAAQGRSGLTTTYAVTLARVSGGWQVSDIQLASAGNS